MEKYLPIYIWQTDAWPNWQFEMADLALPLADAARAQGMLYGRLADIGFALREEANLLAITEDVIKTSEIEGETLNAQSVRSSVARHLGVDIGALLPADRAVDGVVEMVLDATLNVNKPLTSDRLFGWHAALFPTGYSGLSKISVGAWRDDRTGPMQVVSGGYGRQRVHYEAPPATRLSHAMQQLLDWMASDSGLHPFIRAGIGHLWFVTLHPFDDGNGRIARAIGDWLLASGDANPQRFYSVSAQIQRERNAYYEVLERTQKGSMEITPWLTWFLGILARAMTQALQVLDSVLFKSRFWQQWASVPMTERQKKVLNRWLDGFEGNMTSRKWAAIGHCSKDSAVRDINELIELGVLAKTEEGGRSSRYVLCLGAGEKRTD
ncbi:Fic family protein [Leeia sp. TBRC 13508]|uniref:Fic family protein n=1 Tax=Leeia speluncae TaxID=2884804 RepID=A0ABS8D434_9NEIS|nr:Fic family protein [Leeia speluncae]MCB6182955.1 Fic family protein [Leeia speluncae]